MFAFKTGLSCNRLTPVRILPLALIALFPLSGFGDTRALAPATREGLVGTWDALAQDGSMATAVYQMVIPKEGEAHLIHLVALGDGKSYSHFLW